MQAEIAVLNGQHQQNGLTQNGSAKAQTNGSINFQQMPPHNIEAEEGLLGALMIDADLMIELDTLINSGDFFLERNRIIFQAMKHLYSLNAPLNDQILLIDELGESQLELIGGPGYLTGLMANTPTSVNGLYYARIVQRLSVARQVIQAAAQITALAYADEFASPEALIGDSIGKFNQIDTQPGRGSGLQPVSDSVNLVMDRVERMQEADPDEHNLILTGVVPSGLSDLDRILGGFKPGCFYVIAGRPGMGKSTLVGNIALHLARFRGMRAGIFSLEMPDDQWSEKLISNLSRLDSKRFSVGPHLTEHEMNRFLTASAQVSELPIYIDDQPGLTISSIRSRAIRAIAKHDLDILFVDHLGKIEADWRESNLFVKTTLASNAMLNLAKELRVPVVALCQLSREVEKTNDKIPRLVHLRNSGEIEQDAEGVIMVYREDAYVPDTDIPNVADLIIAKNRGGAEGKASTYFNRTQSRFEDLALSVQEF